MSNLGGTGGFAPKVPGTLADFPSTTIFSKRVPKVFVFLDLVFLDFAPGVPGTFPDLPSTTNIRRDLCQQAPASRTSFSAKVPRTFVKKHLRLAIASQRAAMQDFANSEPRPADFVWRKSPGLPQTKKCESQKLSGGLSVFSNYIIIIRFS